MATLNFDEVRKTLSLADESPFYPDLWQESGKTWQGPDWMEREALETSLKDAGQWEAIGPDMVKALPAPGMRPALARLAWHCALLAFDQKEGGKAPADAWKEALKSLGPGADFFCLLVLLSRLPVMRAFYKEHGLPEGVFKDTLSDIALWCADFRGKNGRPGLSNLAWLSNHVGGRLFRLGRLQYIPTVFKDPVRMFRNRATGKALIFAGEGTAFRRDGKVDGSNNQWDPSGRWVSHFQMEGGRLRGQAISEDGRALPELLDLDAKNWEQTLGPGDRVLDTHIPAGSSMGEAACQASFQQAREFFTKYFPEMAVTGAVCTSWLLDSAWPSLLPPDSNIVRFVAAFHIYPVQTDDSQLFERCFGSKPLDLKAAPRDTRLRRVILDYLESGGVFTGKSGGILKDFAPTVSPFRPLP